MRPITEKAYRDQVMDLGQKLMSDGAIPLNLQNDPYFVRGFARNLYRTREHLYSWKEKSGNYHPEHHIFVGHIMLQAGYIVFGKEFSNIIVNNVSVPSHRSEIDVNFGEQEKEILELLQLYAEEDDMRGSYRAYEELRDKASLHDQVDIIEKHIVKIPAKSDNVDSLENVMFWMGKSQVDPQGISTKYKAEVILHTYLVGALIKKIYATEQLKSKGLESLRPMAQKFKKKTGKKKKRKKR